MKNIKYFTEGGGGVSDYLDCSSNFIRQNGLISQNGENTLWVLLEVKYLVGIVTDQSFKNSPATSALTSPSSSISIIWHHLAKYIDLLDFQMQWWCIVSLAAWQLVVTDFTALWCLWWGNMDSLNQTFSRSPSLSRQTERIHKVFRVLRQSVNVMHDVCILN